MFNIKKQIKLLYASSIMGQISLSAAWVAILAARGFSLAQIGLAEMIFHIVSLSAEIPSGVFADVFGRKKTLVISSVMRNISNLIMVLSNDFFMVCLAMGFNALYYNFLSGAGEALAYDSLKSVGQESQFERYASNEMIIYRLCEGLCLLLSGFSLFVGYKIAYSVNIFFGIWQMVFLLKLKEVRLDSVQKNQNVWKEIGKCFKKSFAFLIEEKKALMLMFANSFVGALDVLLVFFLQAKLPQAGMPSWALGFALFFMQLGGIFGAKLVLVLKNLRYKKLFWFMTSLVILGILLEHSGLYLIMTLGGVISILADDILQIRTNCILQDMFPSEQQQQIRTQLSTVCEGVISQQLIPTIDGRRRVAALEVMIANPAIRNLIRDNKTYQIPNIIHTGSKVGMQAMDQELVNLYRQGLISRDSVLSRCTDFDYTSRLLGGVNY